MGLAAGTHRSQQERANEKTKAFHEAFQRYLRMSWSVSRVVDEGALVPLPLMPVRWSRMPPIASGVYTVMLLITSAAPGVFLASSAASRFCCSLCTNPLSCTTPIYWVSLTFG